MVKGEGKNGEKGERRKGKRRKGKQKTRYGKQDTGYRRRERGDGKRETGTGDKKGNGKQLIRQTIHLNAPPPQNCIGATTIHLNAKKMIDNEGFNF